MLKGRLFVGMARGYQTRWQNVIGQRFGVTSTASDRSAADQRNRLLFDEHYKILKMAWENDLLRYKGPVYEIPHPFEDGIPKWPPSATTTAKYGVPGEVDENGTVRGISVVPKPYSQPHPQLFQAFGASPRTLEWCGQENVTPTILAGPMEMVKQLAEAYREGARSRGRNPALGEGVGLCRTIHFTKNKADIYHRRKIRSAGLDRMVRAVRLHGRIATAGRGRPRADAGRASCRSVDEKRTADRRHRR
jgi:alkanesulfonate monooxygenase SsuD/methylene tetrahydromethanopterin reductase-like flavin-dependent oxidoreductase (luciferase family)